MVRIARSLKSQLASDSSMQIAIAFAIPIIESAALVVRQGNLAG
ncbi:hypothetical protein [Nostoc sp. PCC 9305]